MKKSLFMVLMLNPVLFLSAQQKYTDNQDIEVVLPDLKTPTEEQIKINQIIKDVNKKLPYKGYWVNANSTLGVLCKVSDNIIIGRVTSIQRMNCDGSPIVKSQAAWTEKMEIAVATNLFGRWVKQSVILTEYWTCQQREIKSNECVIVFLSKKNLSPYSLESRNWNFDVSAVSENSLGKFHLQGKDRGLIAVSNKEEEVEYVDVINRYIKNVRNNEKYPEKYYALLCDLMKSTRFRIKEDARSDMLNFLISCNTVDLRKVLADKNIDDGIKNYLRLILIPNRGTKTP